MENRLTITEVAKAVGVTPRTIMRWEKAKKIRKPKRDWRGWRFYHPEDVEEIKRFYRKGEEEGGEKVEGKVWTGFIGECKQNKRNPCYVIQEEPDDEWDDAIFICDVLKKFVRRKVVITIKIIGGQNEQT